MHKHLNRLTMLCYLDGELSRAEARRVARHLHSCWMCRADVKRLETDIAEILDSHDEILTAALPNPPGRWSSFDSLLAQNQLTSNAAPGSQWLAGLRSRVWRPSDILTAACAAVAAAAFCWMTFRPTPVSAREVLHRMQMAGAADMPRDKDQVLHQRIQIRKSSAHGDHVRPEEMDAWKSQSSTYWETEEDNSAARELEEEYSAHHIAADLPLSAAAACQWGQAAGGDPVIEGRGDDFDLIFNGDGTASSDSVRLVRIVVRSRDWRVEQMTLQFSAASFEVVNEDFSQLPTSQVPHAVLAHLDAETVLPVAHLETHSTPELTAGPIQEAHPDLDAAELDVFNVLHRMNADLGEPVTISRQAGEIQVGIWQVPPDRRSVLKDALADKPGVVVRDAEPAYPPTLPGYTRVVHLQAQPDSPAESEPGDERRFSQFFGSPDSEETFTRQALGTSTAILAHLYALRNLQDHFPARKEADLDSAHQQKLMALVDDHRAAVEASLKSLNEQFAPLMAAYHIQSSEAAEGAAVGWQNESLDALNVARTLDHLVRSLLATGDTPVSAETALPDIQQSISRLSMELGQLKSSEAFNKYSSEKSEAQATER